MKRLWWLPGVAAIVVIVLYYSTWRRWIAVHTGSSNGPGVVPNYNFWSGFGSDLGEYILVVTFASHLALLWRTHTCHYAWWCWRHPKHQLGNTGHMLCRIHHPADIPTAKDAVKQYTEAQSASAA